MPDQGLPVGSLRRLIDDDEGVSLVEVMVAILVLGIVLTALASTLVTSLQSAGRQESDIQANAVANAVVEDLRGRPFREVALCTTEATTTLGGTSFEGEPLVLLPDTDPQCSEADRPLPSFPITQDGRAYTAQLAVAWVDDDGDGVGAGDADTPQDYKRVLVDLTWQDRGRTYTARTEARRAPEALDQPMSVQIDPLVTRLRDEGDASGVTGRNDAPFELRATHVLKQSSVVVTWRSRSGAADSLALTSGDGGFTWANTVPFNDGLFPNGETLFTFKATSPSSEVTEVVTRALLLHDLEYLGVTAPTSVEVLPDGTVCSLPVSTQMRGMLLSDTLDLELSHEPGVLHPLSGTIQTANGADFSIDLTGRGGFPVPLLTEETMETETITATLTAERVVNPPAPVVTSWAITVFPTLACAS